MDVQYIEWDRIHPAPDNPNSMTDARYAALRSEIELRGFVQPILVRPHPDRGGHFELIDGEHRWRALGDLGHDTVPSVVDAANDAEASTRRITMNRLRGQFVPVRMAHVLADLTDRIPESEIRQRLDMDAKELRNYLALGTFAEEEEMVVTPPRPKGPKEKDNKTEIVFLVTNAQMERAEQLLEALTVGEPDAEGAALARQSKALMAARS